MTINVTPQTSSDLQYISDAHGNVQSVIVPIAIWETIAPEGLSAHKESVLPPRPARTHPTTYGAFPALATVESGDDIDAIKQLLRDSVDKQIV